MRGVTPGSPASLLVSAPLHSDSIEAHGSENAMPLWKIHHPAGAYSDADKSEFAEAITGIYTQIPIPAFYVVTIFEEVTRRTVRTSTWAAGHTSGSCASRSTRWPAPSPARSSASGGCTCWTEVRPFIGDCGYDWEFTCSELQAAPLVPAGHRAAALLIGGEAVVKENKALAYGQSEMLPASFVEAAEKGEVLLAPGVHGS